jgi:hypothetical protein
MAAQDHSGRRPRRQRPPLTDGLARSLPRTPPRIYYDAGANRIAGFGLRVSPTARTWVLNYTIAVSGRSRVGSGAFGRFREPGGRPRRAAEAGLPCSSAARRRERRSNPASSCATRVKRLRGDTGKASRLCLGAGRVLMTAFEASSRIAEHEGTRHEGCPTIRSPVLKSAPCDGGHAYQSALRPIGIGSMRY